MTTWYGWSYLPQKTAGIEEPWFHGSTQMAPFERFDPDKVPRNKNGPKHWNSHLGSHFTSEHDTAAQIAFGHSGAVYHVDLAAKNPKHYHSEHDLDRHMYEHTYSRTSTPEGADATRSGSPRDFDEALRYDPDIHEKAQAFKEHLRSRGHDGITYGNEYEGSHLHTCAIAFHPEDITIHSVHHASEPCEEGTVCPECLYPRTDRDWGDCSHCGHDLDEPGHFSEQLKTSLLQHFAEVTPEGIWDPEYTSPETKVQQHAQVLHDHLTEQHPDILGHPVAMHDALHRAAHTPEGSGYGNKGQTGLLTHDHDPLIDPAVSRTKRLQGARRSPLYRFEPEPPPEGLHSYFRGLHLGGDEKNVHVPDEGIGHLEGRPRDLSDQGILDQMAQHYDYRIRTNQIVGPEHPAHDRRPMYGSHWTADPNLAHRFAFDASHGRYRVPKPPSRVTNGVVLEMQSKVPPERDDLSSQYGETESRWPGRSSVERVIAHVHRYDPEEHGPGINFHRTDTHVRSFEIPQEHLEKYSIKDRPDPDPVEYRHHPPRDPYSEGKPSGHHTLNAFLEGTQVGRLSWWDPGDGPYKDNPSFGPKVDKAEVASEHRRRGLAAEMFRRAQEITPGIQHSDRLSGAGRAWRDAVSPEEAGTPAYSTTMQHRLGAKEDDDLDFRDAMEQFMDLLASDPSNPPGTVKMLNDPEVRGRFMNHIDKTTPHYAPGTFERHIDDQLKGKEGAKDDTDAIMDLLGPGVSPQSPQAKDQAEAEHQQRVREHAEKQTTRPGYSPGDDLSGWDGYPHAEWVPIEVAKRFREHSGEQHHASQETVDEIAEDLKSGRGMTDPLMLLHHNEKNVATLGEGNHRLTAAERAGWSHVPMRVCRMYDSEVKGARGNPPPRSIPARWRGTHQGRTPEMCSPSDMLSVGSKAYPVSTKETKEAGRGHQEDRLEGHPGGGPALDRPSDLRRDAGAGQGLQALAGARVLAVGPGDQHPALEWHPKCVKDWKALAPHDRKRVGKMIDQIVDQAQNLKAHPLKGDLEGYWAAESPPSSHRVVYRPLGDGRYFIGHVTAKHDYTTPNQRLGAKDTDHSNGVMVALVPPPKVAEALVVEDGTEPVDHLHITLAYLGETTEMTQAQLSHLPEVVRAWAEAEVPLDATTQGAGTFLKAEEEGQHVMWASVAIPGVNLLHERLINTLEAHGYSPRTDHEFTPHITLSYSKYHVRFLPKVERMSFDLDEVWCCIAGEWEPFPLGNS